MAHRDKAQGFGFIYTDIQTLLRSREDLAKSDSWQPIEAPTDTVSVNLNRDSSPQTVPPTPVEAAPQSVDQIKENLDRLAKLHQKLHVMLDEIQKLSSSSKKTED